MRPGAAKYLNASCDQKRYRVTSVQTAAPPPSSVLHAAIAQDTRNSNGKRGGPACPGSLPPMLWFDALGGHLACRWGTLLRHVRLPRLGHQARLFVHLDPLLARNRRDQLANRFERQIVRRLEMNATLAHVELLSRRLDRRLQFARADSHSKTRPSGKASSSSSATRARRSRLAACCKCLDIETGGSSSRSCPRRGTHRNRAECACSRVRAQSRSSSHDRRGVRRCIALAS